LDLLVFGALDSHLPFYALNYTARQHVGSDLLATQQFLELLLACCEVFVKRVEVHFKVLVFGFQLDVVLKESVCFNFKVEEIVGHVFDVFFVQALG